jgi:acyl carrier protein
MKGSQVRQNSMEDVRRVIRSFILDNFLFGQVNDFSDSDSFLENGLIDSMGILMLVEFVKDACQLEVADEEIIPENWDSIELIANFVEGKNACVRLAGGLLP